MEGSAAEAVLQKEESSRKRVEDCTLSATSQVEKTDMNLVSGCDIGWEDLHLGEQVGQGNSFNLFLYTIFKAESMLP